MNLDTSDQHDAEIRIPTNEYGYVHVHFTGTFEDIHEANRQLHALFDGGEGIPEDTFRDVVDKLCAGEPVAGGIELWQRMSQYQKDVAQEIKRSGKRRSYKTKKEN